MELENGVHAYVECGYLAEAHNPPEYGSSDNRLTVYGKEGYVYAETDGSGEHAQRLQMVV